MNPNWLLIFMGLGSVILELLLGVATGFDLLLVGSALIIGGTTGLLLNSPTIGTLVAAVLSLAYILFGRKIIKAKLKSKSTATNVDRLLGKTAQVVSLGQIKIEGEVWRIVSDQKIEIGDLVKVVEIEGSSLKVVKS